MAGYQARFVRAHLWTDELSQITSHFARTSCPTFPAIAQRVSHSAPGWPAQDLTRISQLGQDSDNGLAITLALARSQLSRPRSMAHKFDHLEISPRVGRHQADNFLSKLHVSPCL